MVRTLNVYAVPAAQLIKPHLKSKLSDFNWLLIFNMSTS